MTDCDILALGYDTGFGTHTYAISYVWTGS